MAAARCRLGAALFGVSFLLAARALAAEDPPGPSITQLYLTGSLTAEGTVELRCEVAVGPKDAEPVETLSFIISRTADTGDEQEFFPAVELVEKRPGRSDFRWTDTTTKRGRTYRYYVEYSADVYLCSNTTIVTTPAEARESGAKGQDSGVPFNGLFIEVAGPEYTARDRIVLAVARPSKPGGTYSWESVVPSTGTVVLQRRNRALLKCLTAKSQAIWRVTYDLDGETAQAYYRPHVAWIELSHVCAIGPQGPAWGAIGEVLDGRRRHAKHMREAEGIGDLRRAIRIAYGDSKKRPEPFARAGLLTPMEMTRAAIREVGAAALPELHAFLAKCRDPDKRATIIRAIADIDREYVSMLLLPELVGGDDVAGIDCAISCFSGRKSRGQVTEAMAYDLARGLGSPVEYVRILTCRVLAEHHVREAIGRLEEIAARDKGPLVRFWAAHAVHVIRTRGELRGLGAPLGPGSIDPDEVRLAADVYPAARREIHEAWKPPEGPQSAFMRFGALGSAALPTIEDPQSAFMRFRVLGSAALPIIAERLNSDDSDQVEMNVLGELLRGIGSDLPQQTKEFYADRLARTHGEAQHGTFARYKSVVRGTGFHLARAWPLRRRDIAARLEEVLADGFVDQCYATAKLAVFIDEHNMIPRPVVRSSTYPSGLFGSVVALSEMSKGTIWREQSLAARRLCERLQKEDGLLGRLARDLLVPPPDPDAEP